MPPGERSPARPGPCKTRLFKELCKAGARGWRKGPLTSHRGGGGGRKLGRGPGHSGGGGPEEVRREIPERREIGRQNPQSGFKGFLESGRFAWVVGGQPLRPATKNGRFLTNPPPGWAPSVGIDQRARPALPAPAFVSGPRDGGLSPGLPPAKARGAVPSPPGPLLPRSRRFKNKPSRPGRVAGNCAPHPALPRPSGVRNATADSGEKK